MAIARFTSARPSAVFSLSIWMVLSTRARLLSVPTTIPASICPNSIMLATWTMPSSRPRQALERS